MSEEPQSCARRKALAAARVAARHLPEGLPGAFFLTDPARTLDILRTVRVIPCHWGVIYRHFGAADRTETGHELAKLCRAKKLMLLIAADPQLAVEVGAEGVHWPHRLAGEARFWRGRFRIQTASAHGRAQLARLGHLPVDAALVSAVFPSASPSAGPAMGALRFRRLARSAALPVYGLGGVRPENARRIADFAGLAAVDGWRCFED